MWGGFPACAFSLAHSTGAWGKGERPEMGEIEKGGGKGKLRWKSPFAACVACPIREDLRADGRKDLKGGERAIAQGLWGKKNLDGEK